MIKLAGTNPYSRDTGQCFGKVRRMTRRGRAGMRHVLYMAAIYRLLHNPRIRAHYDRLIHREDRHLAKMAAIGACMNKWRKLEYHTRSDVPGLPKPQGNVGQKVYSTPY